MHNKEVYRIENRIVKVNDTQGLSDNNITSNSGDYNISSWLLSSNKLISKNLKLLVTLLFLSSSIFCFFKVSFSIIVVTVIHTQLFSLVTLFI
ncbi:hypothetical protein K502DRAFT_323687 [Neoconidiobolus thromboides FSU 785]|nr:hypothetical protein K502DRAFT_323687 [Neoconidiobolus thromboides FSU 785]